MKIAYKSNTYVIRIINIESWHTYRNKEDVLSDMMCNR